MAAKTQLSIVVLLILLAAGCRSALSIESWQRDVDRYVTARGDPSALRDVTLSGNRRGFSLLGGVDPIKSTDINGLLLGHKTVGNRAWFIYLVGKVDEMKVQDIRLAAVSFADAKSRWAISPKDTKAVDTYRHYNEGLWKRAHPHTKVPGEYSTFPRDADAFELTGSETVLHARHPPSGAAWRVDVAQQPTRK